MHRTLILALVGTVALSAAALASGSSRSRGGAGASVDPYQVTLNRKCTVSEIQPDGRIIVLDQKTEQHVVLQVSPVTRFSAQNKKAFDGRKKLTARDLEVGQLLKVTLRQVNGEVLRVRVLKST